MIFSDQDLLETFLQTEVHILYWDRENLPSDEVTTPLKSSCQFSIKDLNDQGRQG